MTEQDTLERVALAAEEARAARERAREADHALKAALREAATPGANITALARAAGITRQNVYKHLKEAS